MTDAYYELIDPDDPVGERFTASDHVISTWASTMQNAAPVSALLVRALERCAARDDTRISRVVVDLLGPVPMTDRLWTRARVQRRGTKIELVGAEMLAPGPDGEPRPVATATAWRFQREDSENLPGTPFDPLRPLAAGRRRFPTMVPTGPTSRAWTGGGSTTSSTARWPSAGPGRWSTSSRASR